MNCLINFHSLLRILAVFRQFSPIKYESLAKTFPCYLVIYLLDLNSPNYIQSYGRQNTISILSFFGEASKLFLEYLFHLDFPLSPSFPNFLTHSN